MTFPPEGNAYIMAQWRPRAMANPEPRSVTIQEAWAEFWRLQRLLEMPDKWEPLFWMAFQAGWHARDRQ